MRRVIFLMLLSCCGVLFPGVTFFGPEIFVRENGGPDAFSRQFAVCRVDGVFTLHVLNGDDAGNNRVSSATIKLNGQEIVRPSDLNQKVARIDRVITGIAEQNVIEIRLTSNPGGRITVEITGEAACGIELLITEPLHASIVHGPWVIVKGTLESPSPDVGIVVNGRAAELDYAHQGYGSDPYKWAVRLPVPEGPYAVVARAKDEYGNEDSVSIDLVIASPSGQLEMTITPEETDTQQRTDFILEEMEGVFAELTMDYEGDGQVDAIFTSMPEAFYFYYGPGLYFPKARYRNQAGMWFEAEGFVIRYSRPAIDGMIRRKWNAFRQSISSGDMDKIRTFYTNSCWQRHAEVIQLAAQNGALQTAADAMEDIVQESLHGGIAEYVIIHNYNGQVYGNYLYFVKCADGVWRVDDF